MARAHRVKNNLRHLRKEKGLTMEQLAEKVGVHFTTIAKIERHERGLSIDMLAALSRALGVLPIEILGNGASADPRPIRMVPLISASSAANWREAISDPEGALPCPDAGENAFAITLTEGELNSIIGNDAIVVIDPDDVDLRDGKIYSMVDGTGGPTFKRFHMNPLRLEPVSSNPGQKTVVIGQEPFTIIGRATWQISSL